MINFRGHTGFLKDSQCYEENRRGNRESSGSGERTPGSFEESVGGISEEGSGREETVDFEKIYHDVAVNCFRYFNFTSFEQVDRLTVAQYNVMMEALELKCLTEISKHTGRHILICCACRTKNRQKTVPVYKKFQKFFDYERELENLKKKRTKKTDPRFCWTFEVDQERRWRKRQNLIA